MRIVSDRTVSAMLPLGAPLPLVTSGERNHEPTFKGGARMLAQTVDTTVTALVRPLAGPVLGATGAAKRARSKPNPSALKTTGAAVKGAGTGLLVGLSGAALGLGEAVLVDAIGGVCLLSALTCGQAIKGLAIAIHAVFGGHS